MLRAWQSVACKPETASHAAVLGLAKAMAVAFFERFIRDDAAYQTYLDGAQAKALGVSTSKSK
jgi:hypothetical protein